MRGYHRSFATSEADTHLTDHHTADLVARCLDTIGQVVVGQRANIELLLVAVFCYGH
jgi:hypothetical protein